MTWWVVDNAIRESLLPPPCRLVLRTLADQINPPPDWDHRQPEAWDPATHQDDLVVWCDRETLSHATGYSPDSLRRIMGKLVHDYAVLHLVEPARQHYTAHWRLDLEALRGWGDPWFAQRKADSSRRRRAARQVSATVSRHGNGAGAASPSAAPAEDHGTARRCGWATCSQPVCPHEVNFCAAHAGCHACRDITTQHPRQAADHGAGVEVSQGAYLTDPAENQGAYLTPSEAPERVTYVPSDARALMVSPCFTSSSLSPHDISPQAGGGDFQSQEEGPAPVGAAGNVPAERSLSVPTPADAAGTLATDHGPPGELSAFVRQIIARQGLSPEGEQVVRRQLITALRPLDPPNGNGHSHKSPADYDAERQRQFAAARAAGLDIGERGHSDHGANHHREEPAGAAAHPAPGVPGP
jgi:hypothetical protein